LELNLRIKPKKRLKRDRPDALAVPDIANHTWSITARQVIACNHREGISWLTNWQMGVHIQYIQPCKPQQNAYNERYSRTVRHEWLDQNIFETIEEAQEQATHWLWTYNNDRPNMGIGGITPAMKLNIAA